MFKFVEQKMQMLLKQNYCYNNWQGISAAQLILPCKGDIIMWNSYYQGTAHHDMYLQQQNYVIHLKPRTK